MGRQQVLTTELSTQPLERSWAGSTSTTPSLFTWQRNVFHSRVTSNLTSPLSPPNLVQLAEVGEHVFLAQGSEVRYSALAQGTEVACTIGICCSAQVALCHPTRTTCCGRYWVLLWKRGVGYEISPRRNRAGHICCRRLVCIITLRPPMELGLDSEGKVNIQLTGMNHRVFWRTQRKIDRLREA